MGKATLAKQRAIGAIGGGKVRALEDAGLEVNEAGTLARLKELERRCKLLREATVGHAADARACSQSDVAAMVLREAMEGKP